MPVKKKPEAPPKKENEGDVPAVGSREAVNTPAPTQSSEIVEIPGKPRIIAGVCEFCGVTATECKHAK